MSRNTSITLGRHFEDIVEKGIASGRYASVSEVIRAGLRLLEEEENRIEALRKALVAGEESGFVEHFDSEAFLDEMHRKHRAQ
ncbi:type II toxin-antitoxin system ParD family antitoxin [Arenibacter certesii]|uniref:Antitoxin ParD1 n=1 Tax=Arenibacter certesii TaxID=228955 RepID=A0A918MNS6_9FLAO|nr:type II toxin-antitoxin system ParD family antitoxin [Arenibacter certesii]GGW42495.1 antitoxin ParD1 [Arenibacter certesii]